MASFTNSALRLMRRLLGAPARSTGPHDGEPTALDGNTAVAVTEAMIAEAAGLGASFPAETAEFAWRAEQVRHGYNPFGAPLETLSAEGPRGALAAAIGLTLGGTRATAFLSAPDLAGALDLLRAAAGRRLPLVVHLCNRALPGPAPALGSGHEALHLATASGCFVLVAANVQEAVDFTLIARRVAEQTLTPGLVVMDGEQTALAMQDIRLPPAGLVTGFLGRPDDDIQVTHPAQRLVFGERRRRVPRRHDLDHPVLLGSMQPRESWGLAAASAAFFEGAVDTAIDRALTDLGQETGRRQTAVSAFRVDDARLVLIVQGAAVETAEAVARHLREHDALKVGVLGLRRLHPFPDAALLARLDASQLVLVLERVDVPLTEDPPLLRALRAALQRAAQPSAGRGRQPTVTTLDDSLEPPRYPNLVGLEPRSVIHGLGGLALRGADLIALCQQAILGRHLPRYLGIDFAPATSDFPKRQILLDRLRRHYPGLADLGLRAPGRSPDLRPSGALTLSIHRRSGQRAEGLAAETAGFLFGLFGARLRGQPALAPQPWGSHCIDRLTCGPADLRDPGADPPTDLAVLATDPALAGPDPLADIQPNGALLVLGPAEDGLLWPTLAPALQQSLRRRGTALYALTPSTDAPNASLLGAICGVLLERGWLDLSARRVQAAWDCGCAETEDPAGPAFAAGLTGVRQVDYDRLPDTRADAPPLDDQAPSVVRALGHGDDRHDSLPRFWDQVGVLYRTGATAELTPDPYLALAAIPPLASALRDLSGLRATLPQLDPALCTGCGDCWALCPDNAIGAVAITAKALLDATLAPAGAAALQPQAGRLAERMIGNDPADRPAQRLGDWLDEALSWLVERLPADRQAAARAAGERLSAALGVLPVAVTEHLFQTPETRALGTGRLLFLALDPSVCKGCGICARVCTPGALSLVQQDRANLARAVAIRQAWERLPDTASDSIEQAAAEPNIGPLKAALLGRHAVDAMAGGDGVESGSGARLSLRLALAIAESRQAPARAALIERVGSARERIAGLIRSILADALPADDLDSLARGLASVETRQTDLGTFIHQAEGAVGNALDAERLRRLVELARQLADLHWRLTEGRQGIRRADLSLVLCADDPDGLAGTFPQNSFRIPVTVDSTGDGAQLAAGLLDGQLRQATAGLALLRKARLEFDQPADARRLWSDLEGLSWRALDAEERATCPTLLLVGGSRLLAGRGLSQLIWLLGSGLPVKVMVLAELDLGLADRAGIDAAPAAAPDPAIQLALLALSQRNACVVQTSLGAPEHLRCGLDLAFDYPGPALLHLHAPSPGRHGFASDRTIEQARLALASRAFPLFIYDPRAEGVFGSRLDLTGNPAPCSPWSKSPSGEPLTPAHWALTETRFRDCFTPLAEDAPRPMRLAAYLALSDTSGRRRTAFISVESPDREPIGTLVSPELIQVCVERKASWRMLQELAGVVTPFAEQVKRDAEAAILASHQAELADQAADYEERIAGLREEFQQALRRDVHDRLMALAGYR